jgi:hypothetical protein
MTSHSILYPSKRKVVVAVLATILSTVAAILLIWQYTTSDRSWAGVLADVVVLPTAVLAFVSPRFSTFTHGGWMTVALYVVLQLGYCYVLTCLVWRLFEKPAP